MALATPVVPGRSNRPVVVSPSRPCRSTGCSAGHGWSHDAPAEAFDRAFESSSIDAIDVVAEAGKVVVLNGTSSAGKTTIAKLRDRRAIGRLCC
jgi:hypothetical protein